MQLVPHSPALIPGVPSTYATWRPGQREAVERVRSSRSRFVHVRGVPGSGKTLTNMAVAGLWPGRVLYLTNTRPLVAQLAEYGMAPIEGRDNYACDDVWFETCGKGAKKCRSNACPYRQAVRNAQDARAVTTNYAYNAFAGPNLGEFDLVICDEAHNLEGWLSTWLEFRVEMADVRACGVKVDLTQAQWAAAVPTILPFMEERAVKEQRPTERSRLALLARRIRHVIDTKWVCNSAGKSGATFQPDDVSLYAQRKVWRDASKVVLSSASLLPSALTSLGLTNVDRVDLPSTFDYARRPIIYVSDKPQVRIGKKTTEVTYELLLERTRAVCDYHKAHRGIILSHSYELNRRLATLNDRIITHEPGEVAPLEKFKSATSPLILLSPAIGEGVDLPHDACRFIIFPRVPFANPTDPLIAARSQRIAGYFNDLAAVAVIQGVDRGMRAPDDWCYVYVIDGHWSWWSRKVSWPREVRESFAARLLSDLPTFPS